MSLPMSVMRHRVGTDEADSSRGHRPDSRMLGSLRPRKLLRAPYDRPCPSAARTSTSGPHVVLAAVTTVSNPRVRLLAPSATTRLTGPAENGRGRAATERSSAGAASVCITPLFRNTLRVQNVPDLLRCDWDVDVRDAEVRQRVHHGVDDGGGAAPRPPPP